MLLCQNQFTDYQKNYLISSKLWSGTGFYVEVKLKKPNKELDIHCIMTNYHVYLEMNKRGDDMVAVFHHESTEKEPFELPLVPFKLHAQNKVEVFKLTFCRWVELLGPAFSLVDQVSPPLPCRASFCLLFGSNR